MTLITTDWVRMMARYNAWQNTSMARAMEGLTPQALTKDRKAFFGSILATANHLVWADQLWLSRLTGGAGPDCPASESLDWFPTCGAWWAERFRTDGRLTAWAAKLHQVDLTGTVSWQSGSSPRPLSQPTGLVITHLFTHQVHHRGQIHAMLTAAGARTEDTDLLWLDLDL